MVELEADDALASAAHPPGGIRAWTRSASDAGQISRRRVDDRACRSIGARGRSDLKAYARSSATPAPFGFPRWCDRRRLPGHTARSKTAANLLNRYGRIEDLPLSELDAESRELALLFKTLATLRTDAALFDDVEEIRWRGPTDSFATWTTKLADERLLPRSREAVEEMVQAQS
jgi:hypothetical protein